MYALPALALCLLFQSPSAAVKPEHPIVKQSAGGGARNTSIKSSQTKLPPAQSQNAGVPSTQQPTPDKDNEDKNPTDRIYKVDVVSPPAKPLDTPLFPAYLAITGIGVFANLFIACLIFNQSRMMKQQVMTMQQQVHNAAEQVIAAQGSNNRISHQIRLMQTANEQTNKLIEEARINADAAKASADAARKSADAFVQSERAWINARLVYEGSLDHYRLEIANYGRTTGHILHIRFGTNNIEPNTAPTEPYGDTTGLPINTLILPNTEWQRLTDFKRITDYFDPHWREVEVGTKQAIVFFYVVYKDVLGEEHKSRFVYGYRVPTSRLEEFRECREYT